MIYCFIPLVLVMGALGRRIAGGVLNQWFSAPGQRVMGDLPARVIFAVTIALSAFLGGAPWFVALAFVPAVWVGTTTGNFNSIAMGRGLTSYWHDCLGMTAHGLLSGVTPVLVLVAFALMHWLHNFVHLLDIILPCFTCAFFYSLGWNITERLGTQAKGAPPGLHPERLPVGLRGGVELGEALWGAAMALWFFLAFT